MRAAVAPDPSPRPAIAEPGAADRPGTSGMTRARRWLLALGAVLLSPLLGFVWFLAVAAAPPAEPDRLTDGLVVLTGGAERVRTALHLLSDDRAAKLLVSGAHPDATLADLAAAAGVSRAVLEGRVTLGHAARSTRGNAEEAATWARAEGLRSLRLVTAGYHMPRALLELRRHLPPDIAVIAHPVQPPGLRDPGAAGRARTWSLLVGEYAKLVGATLGLSRPGPASGGASPPAPR